MSRVISTSTHNFGEADIVSSPPCNIPQPGNVGTREPHREGRMRVEILEKQSLPSRPQYCLDVMSYPATHSDLARSRPE